MTNIKILLTFRKTSKTGAGSPVPKNYIFLAPTGALIVIVVYYISAAAAVATFSDFHSVD